MGQVFVRASRRAKAYKRSSPYGHHRGLSGFAIVQQYGRTGKNRKILSVHRTNAGARYTAGVYQNAKSAFKQVFRVKPYYGKTSIRSRG